MFRATGNLVLTEDGIRSLNRLLGSLVADAGARVALLMDRGGQLLAAQGETSGLDTMSLAALLVGTFGSNRAIAGILGESDFQLLYQQGSRHSLLLQAIGPTSLLAVLFPSSVPVGKTKFAVEQVQAALAAQIDAMLNATTASLKSAAPAPPAINDLF